MDINKNSKILIGKSKTLSYILEILEYLQFAKENKMFDFTFSENSQSATLVSQKYNVKFPSFAIKFSDSSDNLQGHLLYVASQDKYSAFPADYETGIKFFRTNISSSSTRLESYNSLNSIKGYIHKRIDYDKTKSEIEKIKDTRNFKKYNNEVLYFTLSFIRLIKILSYVPAHDLIIWRNSERIQFRCISIGVHEYHLIVEMTKDLIAIDYLNENQNKREKSKTYHLNNLKEMNEIFKNIIEILNKANIETPFDINFKEEEEF